MTQQSKCCVECCLSLVKNKFSKCNYQSHQCLYKNIFSFDVALIIILLERGFRRVRLQFEGY